MTVPSPFDAQYTATNFAGFALSVDLVGGDQTLGANWQTLSLGSMSLQAQDVPAGGYQQSRFQLLGQLTYGDVTLTRPWTPEQSGWIPEWFALAEQYGPTTVAISIRYIDVNGVLQSAVYNFRNAYPVTWTQPNFAAVPSDQTPPSILETLTFSHAGYFDTAGLTPGIEDAEAVQQFRLVILPGSGSSPGIASALASLTTWTPPGAATSTMLSSGLSSMASAAASMLGPFPSITFWVPPNTLNVSKGADWSVNNTPNASGSGPATWNGTRPLSISFDFVLDGSSADSNGMESASTASHQLSSGGQSSGTSVLPFVEQLLSLCEVDPLSALMGVGTAPLVILLWGEFVSPVSYVENMTMQFTKFNPGGEPTRATGTLALTQFPVAMGSQNPTSGGEVPRSTAVVNEGDSLAHVAYRSYRSPARWRDLAEVNRINDPMRVASGSMVIVPAPEELPVRGESGRVKGPSRSGSASARQARAPVSRQEEGT